MPEKENYEIGNLSNNKDNRYWGIKLGKISRLRARLNKHNITGVIFDFVKKIIGLIVFLILLIPLTIIISIVSSVVSKKIKPEEAYDEVAKKALETYKDFMDVYKTRTYSPVSKSLEMGLFANCDLKPPILEIAIGDGYLSHLIFKNRNCHLDIGGDMIYETILSSKKYSHIDKLVVFDSEEIPFPDNCFQTVIMNNLIHHLPSREKALNEVARVLKPGGQFIFTDNLYGWLQYTFDSRLLRFFRLNFIAQKWENFKLHLFAQKLLTSPAYWQSAAENSQMEVLVNKELMSRRAMTISSIFECLNLLQGQPTRKSMKLLLGQGALSKYLDKKIENIIKYLIINDDKLIDKDNRGAFLFVVLRKKENGENVNEPINDLKYVCPKCKENLAFESDKFVCGKCGQEYIIRKGIPIFLSYQKELPGFKDYVEISDKKTVREYVT